MFNDLNLISESFPRKEDVEEVIDKTANVDRVGGGGRIDAYVEIQGNYLSGRRHNGEGHL